MPQPAMPVWLPPDAGAVVIKDRVPHRLSPAQDARILGLIMQRLPEPSCVSRTSMSSRLQCVEQPRVA